MSFLKQSSSALATELLRGASAIRRRKYVWLLVLAVTLVYSSLSILRHRHFESTAYDLAIFDQAVWQYSNFQPAYSSVRSNLLTENLLGDHFHPILITLAPLYWISDSVEALLIAQAFLFALAIVPIFLFTEKRLGRVAAYLFALSYSIFWGIQNAVEFDFHEIAFAVPLIATAIYLIDERRWRLYFVCVVLLLLTKENLSVLVFFFGAYLLAIKQPRQALISMGAGLVWFFAATKVLIPFFRDPATNLAESDRYYRYWAYNQFGANPLSALGTIFRNPLLVIQTLFSPAAKLQTYWYIFHPFLFLAFFSPLFILAIPLLAERFLAENTHFWGTNYHYTAVFVPVLIMASVDGLARVTRLIKRVRPEYLVIPASCVVLFLNLRLLPQFPLWNLLSRERWRISASDQAGRKAVALVPPSASVTTQGVITPHLSHRRMIYVLHSQNTPDADFVVVNNRLNPYPLANAAAIESYVIGEEARGYRRIFNEEGWIVLKAEKIIATQPRELNDADFVEQSVPDSMIAGETYAVSVTLKNAGLNPWKSSGLYRLAYIPGPRTWDLERVELAATIESGSIAVFDFKVKAPSKPGSYLFHWGMVQDGVAAFGKTAPQVWVNVTAPQ